MRFESPTPYSDTPHQIGEGIEKRVYRLPNDAAHATLEFKYENYSNEQIRGLFYFQKICHLLFPAHIVDISQSGNIPDGTGARAFARTPLIKTDADPLHSEIQNAYIAAAGDSESLTEAGSQLWDQAAAQNEQNEPVQQFLDDAIKAGIWHASDPWGPQDCIHDAAGGFTFVDTHVPWMETVDPVTGQLVKILLFYPDWLEQAISKLPAERQKPAQVFFTRLMQIYRERNIPDKSDMVYKPLTRAELEAEGY